MECRRCATPLNAPGDHCRVCDTTNTDRVILEAGPARAIITMLFDGAVLGSSTVTTSREADSRYVRSQRRNFAGRIVDILRRKRPEAVFAAGDRTVINDVRHRVRFDLRRVPEDDPVARLTSGETTEALPVVDRPPASKIGGSHSTVIGDRRGRRAVRMVADHPHVKKIVPGPIEAGGNGSRSGLAAKVTRSGPRGNLRMLLRDGSTVQETRVVTTAADRETGERIRADLSEALETADFGEA